MGWIGLIDAQGGRFNASGLVARGPATHSLHGPETPLPRGTILLETEHVSDTSPQTILAFNGTDTSKNSFTLQMLPCGSLLLVLGSCCGVQRRTLKYNADVQISVLRLSYSWDLQEQVSRLTLEVPETGYVQSVHLPASHPFTLRDLHTLTIEPDRRDLHPDVSFLAISDQVEPIGPMPGLTGAVPIATSWGKTYADKLRRGDLVITADGDAVPVLRTVQRTVPARGTFRPVLIRAPYFGLDQHIVVAPQQRIVISGTEVEYMFGQEAVLVPARHLINGGSAKFADGPDFVTYHHVLLPDHKAIQAAGCPVESLYIGRLRRQPERFGRERFIRCKSHAFA